MSFAPRIVHVALDATGHDWFDYLAEEVGADDVGKLVRVPFGAKKRIGVILALAERSPVAEGRLRKIDSVLHDGVCLSATDLSLLRFCGDYYRYYLGHIVMAALPPLLRRTGRTAKRPAAGFVISSAGAEYDIENLPARQRTERRLLATLKRCGRIEAAALTTRAAKQAMARLTERGLASAERAAVRPESVPDAQAAPELSADQQAAVDAIGSALERFRVWLLEGVTGSGKTEVYMRLIEAIVSAGKQALVLLPEINLTPQLEARFRHRFPHVIVVSLHSGISAAERTERFSQAHDGSAQIVIGTRLAVFTALARLGIIIVDEEHDSSYKQNEGLRYSARDVAIVRAQLARVPIVLGSATPSLESYQNALTGRYQLLRLTQRAQPRAVLPDVRLVDTRRADLTDGMSDALLSAIAARLERGEQSLVFLNRRGYAPVLFCASCGWAAQCTRCSARLVLHAARRQLRCHHCGREQITPAACPQCGAVDPRPVGHGTQRIEQALQRRFPHARILRVDRDSMARKNAWAQAMRRIEEGEVDLLVGTQMLAKGHDFPNITLAALVEVDQALYSADFRAAERLFALITQVAGRAGRGDRSGEVLIQTAFPQHPLFHAALRQDYGAFARAELALRASAGFPPYAYQALLRAEALDEAKVVTFVESAARAARALRPSVTVYDPVPAQIARVAGKTRLQLLVQSKSRARLQAFLRAWTEHLRTAGGRQVRWSMDVDPLEI